MNAWSNPDAVSESDAERMAAFIEARGNTPDQAKLYDMLATTFAAQRGERLLDVGCATGLVARRLAHDVGESGAVVGVDISETMVRTAQRLCTHPALHFEHGDAMALRFPDESFDGATIARLLLHVMDPVGVLSEVRRVVQKGGRLAVLEWDWGTLAIDHSQRALTRRILDWRCDHHGGQNWAGRQVARLCREGGWEVREIQPLVSIARNADTALVASLRRAAEVACENEIITVGEAVTWVDEIDARLHEGLFFATINDYLICAVR